MTDNNPNPPVDAPATPAPATDPAPAEPVRTPEVAPANPNDGTGTKDPVRTAPAPADADDYKTKFGESTKEANRLLDVLKENNIDPKTGQPIATPADPSVRADAQPSKLTDEELATAIPSFATMNEAEKTVLRDATQTAKTVAELQRFMAVQTDKEQYTAQFDTLIKDDLYKGLGEDADAFKAFAYEEANLNSDLQVLADAFIARKAREVKDPNAPKTPAPKGMEEGTSGAKELKTTDGVQELTAEEAKDLRKKEPRKYMEMSRKGLIKVTD